MEEDDSSTRTSPPVHIFWTNGKNSNNARRLVHPLGDTDESNKSLLRQLVMDCSPASFGKGDQDVLDPSYRKAGKLDLDQFATSFHPADFGILENIEQILLPSVSTDLENSLQFRKVTADLYKLNVRPTTAVCVCTALTRHVKYRLTPGLLAVSVNMWTLLVPQARSARSLSACRRRSKEAICLSAITARKSTSIGARQVPRPFSGRHSIATASMKSRRSRRGTTSLSRTICMSRSQWGVPFHAIRSWSQTPFRWYGYIRDLTTQRWFMEDGMRFPIDLDGSC